jgi:hypothetical protein
MTDILIAICPAIDPEIATAVIEERTPRRSVPLAIAEGNVA